MRFLYQYKTSKNELREGELRASSRDAVYAELKKRGLRASRVTLAPGWWNYTLSILGRRGIAIVVLCVALLSLALYVTTGAAGGAGDGLTATHRHQIYGDPAILESMDASGFGTVFRHEGLRFLAQYAIPGRTVAIRRNPTTASSLRECLECRIELNPSDPREVRELKQIVVGMVEELRTYLSVGTGTAWTYVRRLEERQAEECRIVDRVRRELEANADSGFWEERNKALRELGLRTFSRKKDFSNPRLTSEPQK